MPRVLIERSMHEGYLSNAYLVADEPGGTAVFVDSGAPMDPLLRPPSAGASLPSPSSARTDTTTTSSRGGGLGLPVVTGDFEQGGLSFRALPCPGHSADGLSFHGGGVVFTGDTLFKDAVGGTRDDYEPSAAR